MNNRPNPEFRNPEAIAIENERRSRKPKSFLDHKEAKPLSKFEDPTEHKGRKRLLRNLNKQIAATPHDDPIRKKLFKERRRLEAMQFISRVSADEAQQQIGIRRANLHSKRS